MDSFLGLFQSDDEATEENKKVWMELVCVEMDGDVKFQEYLNWCKHFDLDRYEELTKTDDDPNDKAAWVLSKVCDFANPKIVVKILMTVTENLSRLFKLGEEALTKRNETDLARFFNALNGLLLSFRFEKVGEKKHRARMRLYREKAIDLLYTSLQRVYRKWKDETSNASPEALRSMILDHVNTLLVNLIDENGDNVRSHLAAEIERNSVKYAEDESVVRFLDFFKSLWLDRWDFLVVYMKENLVRIVTQSFDMFHTETMRLAIRFEEVGMLTDTEELNARKVALREESEQLFEKAVESVTKVVEGIASCLVEFIRNV